MTTQKHSQPAHRSQPPLPARSNPALTRAFELLGGPWNGPIIAALAWGPADFAQVRERVPGISDETLAARLHDLAAVGLITWIARPGPPPHGEYALTAHGNAFLIPLAALTVWAQDHLPARGSSASGGPLLGQAPLPHDGGAADGVALPPPS
ncbi:winged helix-turn-helix transcriptional regulator [Streptomyces lincolnensis]|uniref:winged helix-turn-helix transcriptional regulator n=1 Tax=Streptomyces lincolnensis TaxID=1915 RepID=UPI0037CFC880